MSEPLLITDYLLQLTTHRTRLQEHEALTKLQKPNLRITGEKYRSLYFSSGT